MWLAMTTEKIHTKPGEGTPPLSLPSHGQGNTADEAQAGDVWGSITSTIGDSLPTGTQGGDNNNISEADLGVSLPTGTLEGKEPTGTIGGSF